MDGLAGRCCMDLLVWLAALARAKLFTGTTTNKPDIGKSNRSENAPHIPSGFLKIRGSGLIFLGRESLILKTSLQTACFLICDIVPYENQPLRNVVCGRPRGCARIVLLPFSPGDTHAGVIPDPKRHVAFRKVVRRSEFLPGRERQVLPHAPRRPRQAGPTALRIPGQDGRQL